LKDRQATSHKPSKDIRAALSFIGQVDGRTTPLDRASTLALACGPTRPAGSTDSASTLDEMLDASLTNRPRPIPDAPTRQAMKIDPQAAAQAPRGGVVGQRSSRSGQAEQPTVREQRSH
jgi:hypothetical protein